MIVNFGASIAILFAHHNAACRNKDLHVSEAQKTLRGALV